MAFAAAVAAAAAPLEVAGALAFTAVCTWLFLSSRHHHALIALMLYLGLVDGFLRLKTGQANLTLLRDVMLFALVAGVLARQLVSGRRVALPPMSGWVFAFVAAALIQVANPDSGTLFHSSAALRQQLAWVPLFFLAWAVMRTPNRLRVFLVLLCVVAALNGAVSYIQFQLTPEQLSAWGPGYASRVTGTDLLSSRTFRDETGVLRNRPPALGSDMGFGGVLGLLAAPAVLALAGIWRRDRSAAVAAIPLAAGIVVAVATSQARVAVIGTGLAVFAFIALAALVRRSMTTLVSTAVVVLVVVAVVGQLARGADRGAFGRYEGISASPTALVSSTYDYRRGTLDLLPTYMTTFPLGAGLGTVGPASETSGGGANTRRLAGETQPSFILLELGIPGLIIFFGFSGVLVFRSVTRIPRIPDPDSRLMVTAVAAALLALLAAGAVGSITTSSPGAPFFWFAAGTLAYWVGQPPRRAWSVVPARVPASPTIQEDEAKPVSRAPRVDSGAVATPPPHEPAVRKPTPTRAAPKAGRATAGPSSALRVARQGGVVARSIVRGARRWAQGRRGS